MAGINNGYNKGQVMYLNVCSAFAPSIWAASNDSLGIIFRPAEAESIMNGNPYQTPEINKMTSHMLGLFSHPNKNEKGMAGPYF